MKPWVINLESLGTKEHSSARQDFKQVKRRTVRQVLTGVAAFVEVREDTRRRARFEEGSHLLNLLDRDARAADLVPCIRSANATVMPLRGTDRAEH